MENDKNTICYRPGGVIACPLMQVTGSLALKDNSEIGAVVLDWYSISCICTSIFQLPAKEADPQLAMGPSPQCVLVQVGQICWCGWDYVLGLLSETSSLGPVDAVIL